MELKINSECFRECGASAAILLAYIQLNCNDNGELQLNVAELAELAGLSRAWVSQLINTLAYYEYVQSELKITGTGHYKKVYLGRKLL